MENVTVRLAAPFALPAMVEPRELGESAAIELYPTDRKSTRLNSRHLGISYGVLCLERAGPPLTFPSFPTRRSSALGCPRPSLFQPWWNHESWVNRRLSSCTPPMRRRAWPLSPNVALTAHCNLPIIN